MEPGAATSRKQLRLGLRAAVTAVIDSTCYLYSTSSTSPALSSRLLQLLEHRFYISRPPLFFLRQFFRVCVCVCIEIFISRLFEEKIAYVFCREKGLIKKEMEIICVNVLEIVFFVSNLRRSLMFIG